MANVYIELEDYKFARELMRRINMADLEDIVLLQNGIPVKQTSEERVSIKEWRFIGLNNTAYISSLVDEKNVT